MKAIDRLHAWVTAQPVLRVLTVTVRVLLALAFIPAGLVKILNEPFTMLPVSDPAGRFFAGFFSAHGYYQFVGIAQWAAAGFLLVPRTATLGAMLYLPIVVNIFVITVAIGPSFAATRFVTGAMLAADIYLLFWDWDRWQPVLAARRPADARHGDLLTAVGLLVAAGVGLRGVTALHLAWLHHASYAGRLSVVLAAGLFGSAILVAAYRRARNPS